MQAVTRPRAQGYGVSVGDHWFRLATSPEYPLRVYTRDSLAPRSDDAGSPEENVLDLGYAFSRSNLTGGEGLDWWPRQPGETGRDTDPIRFWDSGNVDVGRPRAGEPYSFTLVRDVASWWTPTGSPVDMGTSKDAIYVIEGTNVHRFDDWSDTTAEDTDNIGVTLTQLAVGADNSVAVLDTNGDVWFKGSQTDSYIKVYDSTTDGDDAVAVWWIKDRVIVATNDSASAAQGELVEFLPTMGGTPASPTAVPTSYDTIDTFEGECLDVVDAGHAIVASFSDGSIRSYVPQSDTAGTAPTLTIRARTQVPAGEVAYRLGHNLGQLLVMTSEERPGTTPVVRIYSGLVLDVRFDYVVGDLVLLREWYDSDEVTPSYTKNIVATRDGMYFWVGEDTSSWQLWRYDLVTGGLFRHGEHNRTDTSGSVIFDGRLGFCEGASIYLESATSFVTDGYLITPNITFGLNTDINWVAFTTEVLGLQHAGLKVTVYRTANTEAILDRSSSDWVLVDTLSDISQSGIERNVINATSTTLALKLELTAASAGDYAPEVQRFAVRGFPKHRDWIAEVPINVSDIVEAPNRMPQRVSGLGDETHTTVIQLDGAATDLVIPDPPVDMRGVVDQIMEPVTYVSDRGSQGKLVVLVFRGTRLTGSSSAAAQGNAGVGIAPLGIATVGIGET